jgi:hypothetical protein
LKAFTRPHLSHGPAQVCATKAAWFVALIYPSI